jgi:hypothetical protein
VAGRLRSDRMTAMPSTLGSGSLERLFSILRRHDQVPGERKHLRVHLARISVVVDDQDVGRRPLLAIDHAHPLSPP